MKLVVESLNEFTIYLNKYYIKDLDIKNKEELEKYFRKIFLKLKNNYNLELCGYYNIEIYINDIYGMILDVYRLDSEYIRIFGNKVDLKLTFNQNSTFIFKTKDYFITKLLNTNNFKIYKTNNSYYLKPIKVLDESTLAKLLENTRIIYGEEVERVINISTLINSQ